MKFSSWKKSHFSKKMEMMARITMKEMKISYIRTAMPFNIEG
jgi:hypothetical protein